jgi:hypothetical protein
MASPSDHSGAGPTKTHNPSLWDIVEVRIPKALHFTTSTID